MTDDPAPNQAPAVPAGSPRALWDLVRLLLKGGALLAAVLAATLAIVVFIPDGNDYALATRSKHARLAADVPRKIVLVGGSNLAYGIDSEMIQNATGAHVVNMGMNGYLGVRFMLEEVKPFVRAPDVVVVSLEYDSFYKSVDGTATDLLMIVKTNPATLPYLTWSQRLRVAKDVPYAAQRKLLRLISHVAKSQLSGEDAAESAQSRLINSVESFAGFNAYGDLTSHFGVDWPYPREDGIDLTKTPLDGEVIGLLRDFASELSARGVKVFISYTSAIRYYYERHRSSIERLHAELSKAAPLIVPSPPSEFVFGEELFFDTVYHLNREGRAIRTRKIVDDLQLYLKPPPASAPPESLSRKTDALR